MDLTGFVGWEKMRLNLFQRMSFAGSESFFTKLDSRLGELHEQLEALEVR